MFHGMRQFSFECPVGKRDTGKLRRFLLVVAKGDVLFSLYNRDILNGEHSRIS
jgi:hypothetical protein